MASQACRRHACTIEGTRRKRAARDRQSRASSRSGRHYRFAPPGTPPAVAIGPAVASSVTMASTAHLLMSELGDLSLQHGREGAPQRLLRHQAGSTYQLGGLRCAVDHVRPPSPPGWAGTRGYLEGQKTPRLGGVNNVSPRCEYGMTTTPSAYQGRVVIATDRPSRVDAWGGAWEAVEDVPYQPCIWLAKGQPFRG